MIVDQTAQMIYGLAERGPVMNQWLRTLSAIRQLPQSARSSFKPPRPQRDDGDL